MTNYFLIFSSMLFPWRLGNDSSKTFASSALWPLSGYQTTPIGASVRVTNYDRSISGCESPYTSLGSSYPVPHLTKGFLASGLA